MNQLKEGKANDGLELVHPSVSIILTVCHYREANVSLREPPQVEQVLEPCDGKLSRTVLRGGNGAAMPLTYPVLIFLVWRFLSAKLDSRIKR